MGEVKFWLNRDGINVPGRVANAAIEIDGKLFAAGYYDGHFSCSALLHFGQPIEIERSALDGASDITEVVEEASVGTLVLRESGY